MNENLSPAAASRCALLAMSRGVRGSRRAATSTRAKHLGRVFIGARRQRAALGFLIMAGLMAALPFRAGAARVRLANPSAAPAEQDANSGARSSASAAAEAPAAEVTIEATPQPEPMARKDVPWLGVSTVEASEALASQLDLNPGVGLVITYVAPGSPAQKGGLQKNDVLVQFDDQSLVHPAQLRKLVRVRKEGDTVKLAYYRGGKRQTASVSLGLTRVEQGLWDDEAHAWQGNLQDLTKQLRDLHIDETVRDQMRRLRQSLGNIKIDQKEVQEDVRRGMEQARSAIEQAVRSVTNAEPLRKVLENLAHSGVIVDDKADVVVRSSGKNVKSMVKSDENGTIVLVSNPKLHLTVHDKEGQLLFDGPIESETERAKVPPEIWKRVEPLVSQMQSDAGQPEKEEQPEKEQQ